MLLVVVVAGSAWAQCNTDAECPSGGACTNGACVTPSTPNAPSAPAAATAPSLGDQAAKSKGNWAAGGAAIGFVGTGPVVMSGIIAMAFLIFGPNYSTTAAGLSFTLLTAALVGGLGPLAEAGAASARFDETIYGSPGSRIVGWVMYGLSLGGAAATLVTWFSGSGLEIVSFTLMLGTLITGATALLLFALDAVESGVEAIQWNKRHAVATKSSGWNFRVMPTLSLAPRRSSGSGFDPVLGLVGTF
jgi:hypothetical protein